MNFGVFFVNICWCDWEWIIFDLCLVGCSMVSVVCKCNCDEKMVLVWM